MSSPRKKDGCIDWAGMIQKGENPGGQTSQSPDETIRNQQGMPPQEFKFHQEADGPRWNSGFDAPGMYGVVAVNPRRKRR